MALKPMAIRESRFARRYLCKNCYARLKRDAKRAARRLRRRQWKDKVTKGWL